MTYDVKPFGDLDLPGMDALQILPEEITQQIKAGYRMAIDEENAFDRLMWKFR